MKRAFSLIELIIAVMLVMLVSGGALVYFNNFNSRQKLEKSRDEMILALKLAQNYAKTRQLPIGSTEEQVKYVQALVNSATGRLRVIANGNYEKSYTNILVNDSESEVTILTPNLDGTLYYFAGTGKLGSDANGEDMYGVNETATVVVSNSGQAGGSYQIIINSLGDIKETKYVAP